MLSVNRFSRLETRRFMRIAAMQSAIDTAANSLSQGSRPCRVLITLNSRLSAFAAITATNTAPLVICSCPMTLRQKRWVGGTIPFGSNTPGTSLLLHRQQGTVETNHVSHLRYPVVSHIAAWVWPPDLAARKADGPA